MYMKITNPHDEAKQHTNHVYNVDVEIYKLLKTIKFVHGIMRYIIVLNLMHIPEDCVTWPT